MTSFDLFVKQRLWEKSRYLVIRWEDLQYYYAVIYGFELRNSILLYLIMPVYVILTT